MSAISRASSSTSYVVDDNDPSILYGEDWSVRLEESSFNKYVLYGSVSNASDRPASTVHITCSQFPVDFIFNGVVP